MRSGVYVVGVVLVIVFILFLVFVPYATKEVEDYKVGVILMKLRGVD